MKKNIIALAIASAIAAPAAMADAPTVYGQLNLNIANDNTADAGMSVNSTASRLGIKGSEDLGNGLKAVYKVEFGLSGVADGGNGAQQLTARNQYLGLAGGFGTVLMGRHDVPVKMIQPSDLFNDGAADLGNARMTNGITVAESRVGDVLAYVSPSFSGVKVIAAAVMGEDATAEAAGAEDWTSLAVTYGSTKKGLYLAGGTMSASGDADPDATINRFSAQYKTGGLTVNGMMSTADGDSVNEGTVTHLQAGYKMGKFMPKVKYAMMDPEGGDETSSIAIGLNYSLGKKTTAYIYTVDADEDNAGNGSTDSSYIGMVHKF